MTFILFSCRNGSYRLAKYGGGKLCSVNTENLLFAIYIYIFDVNQICNGLLLNFMMQDILFCPRLNDHPEQSGNSYDPQ